MNQQNVSSRRMILGGFLALLMLSSFGTLQHAAVGPTEDISYERSMREAQRFRSTYRMLKRLRTDRLDECSSVDQEECLDVNHAARLLEQGSGAFLHDAAPKVQTGTRLEVEDLSLQEHAMLLQFVQSNRCSLRLDEVLPGFYELCTRILTDHPAFRPYFTDRQMRRRALLQE